MFPGAIALGRVKAQDACAWWGRAGTELAAEHGGEPILSLDRAKAEQKVREVQQPTTRPLPVPFLRDIVSRDGTGSELSARGNKGKCQSRM